MELTFPRTNQHSSAWTKGSLGIPNPWEWQRDKPGARSNPGAQEGAKGDSTKAKQQTGAQALPRDKDKPEAKSSGTRAEA